MKVSRKHQRSNIVSEEDAVINRLQDDTSSFHTHTPETALWVQYSEGMCVASPCRVEKL